MTIYCLILELWFHLLPVSRRKSRSSSTSISSCAIRLSFSSSAVIGRFHGRPFTLGGLPSLAFCSFRLCRFINPFICSRVDSKCSAISRFVFPSSFIWNTSRSSPFIFVYFLGISKPSYGFYYTIGGSFCHCLFLLGQFSFYFMNTSESVHLHGMKITRTPAVRAFANSSANCGSTVEFGITLSTPRSIITNAIDGRKP